MLIFKYMFKKTNYTIYYTVGGERRACCIKILIKLQGRFPKRRA